jgi:hypothetical protein
MAYTRMTKEERRQGTYDWLNDQPLIALKDDIRHWLRFNPQHHIYFLEWFADKYPTKSLDANLEAHITQIIEWLEDSKHEVEAFEDWYVDQVIG